MDPVDSKDVKLSYAAKGYLMTKHLHALAIFYVVMNKVFLHASM